MEIEWERILHLKNKFKVNSSKEFWDDYLTKSSIKTH